VVERGEQIWKRGLCCHPRTGGSVVVYSYPDEQAIRVISARRAEPLERKQYEEGR
jgi:uncharacterized DUF497 family protein